MTQFALSKAILQVPALCWAVACTHFDSMLIFHGLASGILHVYAAKLSLMGFGTKSF